MNWINLLIRGSRSLENNAGLVAHLEELRKRLIFVLIFFVLIMVGSLAFVGRIFQFLSRPIAGMKLLVLGPSDVVQIYFMIAGVVAFAATTPFLLWQLWKFVSPGLYPHEKKYAKRLILPTTLMFLLGISFGYFVIFPELVSFLRRLAEQHFSVSFTAKEYFSFMFDIVIPFGLLFEMPILIVFLTRIGVLTPQWLRKMRRFAYALFVLIGVLISPPEMISHLSVVVPMVLIYEVSIWLSQVAYKRKLAVEAWWREGKDSKKGSKTATPAASAAQAEAQTVLHVEGDVARVTAASVVTEAAPEVAPPTATPSDGRVGSATVEVSSASVLPIESESPEQPSVAPDRLQVLMTQRPVWRMRPGIRVEERE